MNQLFKKTLVLYVGIISILVYANAQAKVPVQTSPHPALVVVSPQPNQALQQTQPERNGVTQSEPNKKVLVDECSSDAHGVQTEGATQNWSGNPWSMYQRRLKYYDYC